MITCVQNFRCVQYPRVSLSVPETWLVSPKSPPTLLFAFLDLPPTPHSVIVWTSYMFIYRHRNLRQRTWRELYIIFYTPICLTFRRRLDALAASCLSFIMDS